MKILIAGGSGFIGSALTRSMLADGHQVWILTRSPARVNLPAGAQALGWDGRSSQGWLDVFNRMDAVVNLVGETVGQWPWTEGRKRRIRESRVLGGQAMAEAFKLAESKPPVYIQTSGVGYYGPLGAKAVTESARAGKDFSAQVAVDWEASSASVDAIPGVRRAVIRNAIVLDTNKGILPLMALPVRLFVGGQMGSGQQGVSWIHIDDEVRAIRFLIENEGGRGIFNMCAPQPVSSAVFMRSLAKALGRPYWMPAPAFALKLILGEMSSMLLEGQYVLPQHLLDLGFVFKFTDVERAFGDLYPR
ncbi:MAG TPA: TIGR01777 family oxidoreductase [Anaerolineales bacterium]|jgi:hypothetical protein